MPHSALSTGTRTSASPMEKVKTFRMRRARASDFPAVLRLIESDRALFPADLWPVLPSLFVDLLERERVMFCAVEETTSSGVCFLRGSAFLHPSVRDHLLSHPTASAVSEALRLELDCGGAFLNRRQVAASNRQADLVLLNFLGESRQLANAGNSPRAATSMATSTWNFFHAGFSLREILTETADPVEAGLLSSVPLRLVRQRPSCSGQLTWLFQVTRDDALANPIGWPHILMMPAPRAFSFTKHQQQVLELALLDVSDRDVCVELDITEDALKKRWRSIYRTVARTEAEFVSNKTGANLRRHLLQHIRHNLSELRPH